MSTSVAIPSVVGMPQPSPTLPVPIFILGIAHRSGTNYLHDLIRLHPACEPASSVLEEDFLIAQAHLLRDYAESIARFWKKRWGTVGLDQEKKMLYAHIGDGLTSFLYTQLERRGTSKFGHSFPRTTRRVVTKTPLVNNLDLFFSVFPSAPLIILIRDGRSVVESAAKTFNRPYGSEARDWARSARRILEFRQTNKNNNFLIVKYEDVYQNVQSELGRIFAFLGLDATAYDYDTAIKLPVRGSCAVRVQTSHNDPWVNKGINWEPVEKPANFDPLSRWRGWGRAKHERFNWIAGDCLQAFGYAPKSFVHFRWFWYIWNSVCDVLHVDQTVWFLRRALRKVITIKSVDDLRSIFGEVCHRIRDSLLMSRVQNN